MSESSKRSRELMRRITVEVWDEGRMELIDELIAEDPISLKSAPASDSARLRSGDALRH